MLQSVPYSFRLVHIKEREMLSLLSFVFVLLFVRSLISSATTQVPSTLIFSSSDPEKLLFPFPSVLSFPSLFISQLSIQFSRPVTYAVSASVTLSAPVVSKGFPVLEAGKFGFCVGFALELESPCVNVIADSNLQLQKSLMSRFFGMVKSSLLWRFILGIHS